MWRLSVNIQISIVGPLLTTKLDQVKFYMPWVLHPSEWLSFTCSLLGTVYLNFHVTKIVFYFSVNHIVIVAMPMYCVATIVIGWVTSATKVRSHLSTLVHIRHCHLLSGVTLPAAVYLSTCTMFRTFGYNKLLLLNSYYWVYICSWMDVRTKKNQYRYYYGQTNFGTVHSSFCILYVTLHNNNYNSMCHEDLPSELHIKDVDPCSGKVDVMGVCMLWWDTHLVWNHFLGVFVPHGTIFFFQTTF